MSLGSIASSYIPDSVGGGATSTYPTEVLADSPLLYLRLGESSGTTLVDSSGNGRNGTYSGSPTFGIHSLIQAETDTCVYFNNVTSDYATIGSAAWMDVSNVTVTCVVKATPTGLQVLVGRYHDPDNDRSWFLCVDSGQFRFYVQNTSGSGAWVDSGYTAELGKTYFVAIYSNATASGIRIYNSTGLVASVVGAGQVVNPSSRPLIVARSDDGSTYQSDAYIDEVVFYDSVLSDSRIDALASFALSPQPKWINFTSGISPRNGTTEHTIAFPATSAGSLLVVVTAATFTGSIASHTIGWTKRATVSGFTLLDVLSRRSNAGETSLQITLSDPNRALDYAVYEFPRGSRWHSVATTQNTPASLTGLPGSPVVVMAAVAIERHNIDDLPTIAKWFPPFEEDCQHMSDIPGGNAVFLSTSHSGYFINTTASSNRIIINSNGISQETTFAVVVP